MQSSCVAVAIVSTCVRPHVLFCLCGERIPTQRGVRTMFETVARRFLQDGARLARGQGVRVHEVASAFDWRGARRRLKSHSSFARCARAQPSWWSILFAASSRPTLRRVVAREKRRFWDSSAKFVRACLADPSISRRAPQLFAEATKDAWAQTASHEALRDTCVFKT